MIKKSIAVCAAAVLLSAACTAQDRSFEFVNQNIKDVLFIFSTQLGKPILADSTVEGETSFQFAGTDTEKAFNAFLQANRLFAYEDSGVLYISKISVTRNGDGTLSLVSYDASAAQIIERIAHATGTTITYETLPSVKNSICADNVTVTEALEILLKPYSDYSVITEDKYIFVRKESAARKSAVADAETKLEIQEEMQDTADDESSSQTFTAYISKAPLKDALERLFSMTEESYTSFVTDMREIEHVQFAGKNFDESLSLIADGGGAKAVKSGGMWFIFQEETQNIQSSIKGGSAVWKHHTLRYSSFGAVRPVLEARFPYMKFYELPDKSSFTFAIEEKDEKSFDDFIALIDRPAASSVIKLKYIKAEDLIAHLPPSVKAEDIVLTGNNSSIFFKGTDENRKILLKELANVDIPQKRIRYDMLIVQFQKTANLNWSLKFEADNLVPGHRTLLTGALANLLNLNFDVVTVFGYLFALKFNTALAENKASVFADTTLHGVSGENIQFRNTSTYRFRDSTIDPETGEPKYTGVTREIVSGLVLDINGWISGDGMITTTVTASVSKQGVDVSATTGNPPPTSEKLITTQVRSRSGEPVILSGLTQNDSTISDEGIPFLKRIPILNRLFSTYLKTDEQSEMVIYLVPHLEKDSDDENEALNLEKVYGKVGTKIWNRKGVPYGGGGK